MGASGLPQDFRARVVGMRSLSVNDLSVGLHVLYAGAQDDGDVLDPDVGTGDTSSCRTIPE